MTKETKIKQDGFTIIEIIITLVLLAVLAAMMVPYFGTSFTQSGTPVSRLKASMSLNMVMEKITAQYSQYAHWRPNTEYASGAIIIPTTRIRNGYKYSTNLGGTSGATQPAWPITVGNTVTDGTVIWTNAGAAPTLTELQTSIGLEGQDYDNTFGKYRVIDNRFIKFDDSTKVEDVCVSDTTCTDYGRYLKVTIGFRSDDLVRTGETIKTLFVLR